MGEMSGDMPNLVSPTTWKFWADFPEKHIADIEGDYQEDNVKEDLSEATLSASCVPLHWKTKNVLSRPAGSHFLMHMVNNLHEGFDIPDKVSFGFQGEKDTRGNTRLKTYIAARSTGLPTQYVFNPGFCGRTPIGHPIQQQYKDNMLNNLIALCPQGSGMCTARRYEACYYTRVPVVIGTCMFTTLNYAETEFAYQLSAKLTKDELANELTKIAETPIKELHDRAKAARNYFDTTLRTYFKDPTLFFLKYLERHNLWTP